MPRPSPTVTIAPTTITATQCLPRLRPSQPQNLCTMAPRQCARVSGPDVTAVGAQTEEVSRGVVTTGSFRRAPWRYPLHSTRASGGIGRRAGFRCLCPKGCGGSSPPSPTGRQERVRAWMSWSSGKDSALALHRAREVLGLEVTRLLVTLNADADRVSMHAVRRSLLELHADRLGLQVHRVDLPAPCPNDVYERGMREAVEAARADGAEQMVFGDLFLAD